MPQLTFLNNAIFAGFVWPKLAPSTHDQSCPPSASAFFTEHSRTLQLVTYKTQSLGRLEGDFMGKRSDYVRPVILQDMARCKWRDDVRCDMQEAPLSGVSEGA